MSHRPLGCYRRAGWTLIADDYAELPLGDGTELPCIIYQFTAEGMAHGRLIVLHYCHADGQYFDEVMQVLAHGRRGLRRIGYAAQVQIVASSQTLADDSAVQLVSAFAVDSAASIARLFEDIQRDLVEREADEGAGEK
jgi:hypothetical protein